MAAPFSLDPSLGARAQAVRLALFDVDGVLTDGRLFMDNLGQEYKSFHSRDGHGLKMLQRSGVEIGIITGRRSGVVAHRMRELGIRHVHQGAEDKLAVFNELLAALGLTPEQTAFMGDDVVDLPIMSRVGLAAATRDAHGEVCRRAHWVSSQAGGRGAARELCDLILTAQGQYEAQLRAYLS